MSNSVLLLCLLGAGLLVGVGAYVCLSRRAIRPPQSRRETARELDPETLRIVRDRLETFERDSLAFELFLAGNRMNLSAEDRIPLVERYGHCVQEPVLVLSDLAEQGLDFGVVRDCVIVILKEKGVVLDESQPIGGAASDALRRQARSKAEGILHG